MMISAFQRESKGNPKGLQRDWRCGVAGWKSFKPLKKMGSDCHKFNPRSYFNLIQRIIILV